MQVDDLLNEVVVNEWVKSSSRKGESAINATHATSLFSSTWEIRSNPILLPTLPSLQPPLTFIKSLSLLPHPHLPLNMLRIHSRKTKCPFIIQDYLEICSWSQFSSHTSHFLLSLVVLNTLEPPACPHFLSSAPLSGQDWLAGYAWLSPSYPLFHCGRHLPFGAFIGTSLFPGDQAKWSSPCPHHTLIQDCPHFFTSWHPERTVDGTATRLCVAINNGPGPQEPTVLVQRHLGTPVTQSWCTRTARRTSCSHCSQLGMITAFAPVHCNSWCLSLSAPVNSSRAKSLYSYFSYFKSSHSRFDFWMHCSMDVHV